MTDIRGAAGLIKEQKEIIILTHATPDGDTLGCGFALMGALRNMGKRVMLLNSDTIHERFSYMVLPNDALDIGRAFVVAVDTADPKLLGKALEEDFGSRVDLCIDHHPSNKLYARQTLLETESAAACQIVYKVIREMGCEITRDIADCLFTGISTDTGCFRYSSVTAETHRIAGELIALGADHSRINKVMFETKTRAELKLEMLCLEGMEYYFDNRVALISVTRDIYEQSGADESCTDGITAVPRQVEGVLIGVTIKEKADGSFKVSIRTNAPYDASSICGRLGGGGHARAAGCRLEGSLEDIKARVRDAIEAFI